MVKKYVWQPRINRLQTEIEDRERILSWWQQPIEFFGRGVEQLFTTIGATVTTPWRAKELGELAEDFPIVSPWPGGRGYEQYQEWKSQAPFMQVGIPSWRQMGTWIGEVAPQSFLATEEPVPKGQYEQARLGLPELAEIAPLFFLGGPSKTATEKLTQWARRGWKPRKMPKEFAHQVPEEGFYPNANEQIQMAIAKTEKAKAPPVGTALQGTPVAQIPERTLTKDYGQLVYAHDLANQKGLLDAVGKPTKNYRQIAFNITGKKSMAQMDRYEAQAFTEALESAVVRQGKVRIPQTQALITKELMDKLPLLHEVGFKERARQMPYVLKKIGLYDEFWPDIMAAEVEFNAERTAFRQELNMLSRQIGRDPQSKARIFDALENPGIEQSYALNPDEQATYRWFKKFFDDWADRLAIPIDKRRTNYVTHTFEKAMEQDIKNKHPLDPELIRAMDFNFPKQTFNPFLKERLGRDVGLKHDPFAAAEAYEQYALRQAYYNPLVKKMGAYEKIVTQQAGPNAGRYWRAMINRLAGRPDPSDGEVNYTLKEFAGAVKNVPFMGERLSNLFSYGNPAALWSHQYASLLYQAFLGLRPISAIRNLSQQTLAVSEVGPTAFAEGLALRMNRKLATPLLAKSQVLRSRTISFLPGVEEAKLSQVMGRSQHISLWQFKWADRQNVKNSFLAGYAEAKRMIPEAGEAWWVRRGDEVAMKTQYLYTKMAQSLFESTAFGKFLTPFTSWPRNFIELQAQWFKGDISMVYKQYAREAGKELPKQIISASRKRKQAQIYAMLLTSAYVTQKTTDIQALQYVGWTSYSNMARFIGGELPSLEMIGGLADVVGGAIGDDPRQLAEGLRKISPDKFIGIIRQLEAIAEGKRDWIDLFIYREYQKAQAEEGVRPRPSRERPRPSRERPSRERSRR
jgi:hypothetical protein